MTGKVGVRDHLRTSIVFVLLSVIVLSLLLVVTSGEATVTEAEQEDHDFEAEIVFPDSNHVESGEDLHVEFHMTNQKNETFGDDTGEMKLILEFTEQLPEGWTIGSKDSYGGSWSPDGQRWSWYTQEHGQIQDGETLKPSLTIETPETAEGEYRMYLRFEYSTMGHRTNKIPLRASIYVSRPTTPTSTPTPFDSPPTTPTPTPTPLRTPTPASNSFPAATETPTPSIDTITRTEEETAEPPVEGSRGAIDTATPTKGGSNSNADTPPEPSSDWDSFPWVTVFAVSIIGVALILTIPLVRESGGRFRR